MSKFEDMEIIIALFSNESASVGALAGLEHWADTRKDIKLGAIGAMHKEDADISAEIVREADKGFLVSGAMGLAKSLLGPLALVGNVIGGVANTVFKQPDEATPEALRKMGEQMDAGRTALFMISNADEANAYRAQLESMCGDVLLYLVPQEVLEEAAAAIEAAEAEADAEQQAQKEAEKQAKEAKKEEKRRAEEDKDAA